MRAPNKVIWALGEALEEHDPAIAELLAELVVHLEVEKEAAEARFDTKGRLRVAEMLLTAIKLQTHTSRLETIHRLARMNEYDRR